MFISSVPKQRYVLGESIVRARGTPESNPLYDAFPTDIISTPQQSHSDFRPITPPYPRSLPNPSHPVEGTYDQPRSYQQESDQNQPMRGRRHQASRHQTRTGENRVLN